MNAAECQAPCPGVRREGEKACGSSWAAAAAARSSPGAALQPQGATAAAAPAPSRLDVLPRGTAGSRWAARLCCMP